MRFWFDTEFYEDGRTIELISIGVVSEDGRTYYAETPKARKLAAATQWLSANVGPHLTQDANGISSSGGRSLTRSSGSWARSQRFGPTTPITIGSHSASYSEP